MAMADLTISFTREQVVDFTMPFLDLGKFMHNGPYLEDIINNLPKENSINF